MKIKLADLVIRTREVEIPKVCPHCDDPVETQDDYFWSEIAYEYRDPENVYLTMTAEHIPCTCVFCKCGGVLIAGKEAKVEQPPAEVVQQTVWSETLDQVVFT